MRRLLLAIALVGLAAPAAAAPRGDLAAVTLDGVGGVVPGMTVVQIERAWGYPIRAAGRVCGFVPFSIGRVRGRALFSRGRLGALFFDAGARTLSGVGVGTRLATLRKLFGDRLETAPGSQFLFLTRHDTPHWQIRFDLDARGRVSRIGFGDTWSVHVLAGCG